MDLKCGLVPGIFLGEWHKHSIDLTFSPLVIHQETAEACSSVALITNLPENSVLACGRQEILFNPCSKESTLGKIQLTGK